MINTGSAKVSYSLEESSDKLLRKQKRSWEKSNVSLVQRTQNYWKDNNKSNNFRIFYTRNINLKNRNGHNNKNWFHC